MAPEVNTTPPYNKPTVMAFIGWIRRDLARFGRMDDHVEMISASSVGPRCGGVGNSLAMLGRNPDATEERATVRLYTDTNSYTITATWTLGANGYLGCTSTARRARAGETWYRESDLADGPLNEDTWRRILGDIVSYEIVKVHQNSMAQAMSQYAADDRGFGPMLRGSEPPGAAHMSMPVGPIADDGTQEPQRG